MISFTPHQEALLVHLGLVILGVVLIFIGGPRFGPDFGDGATTGAGFMLLGAGANGLVAEARKASAS